MRVIAGSAKSLRLKTVEGLGTRPTTDRIKETLFNMLNPYINSGIFLDLYSGSGGIGIEALSRGEKKAIFVEHNNKCIKCINENLKFTKLSDKAVVISKDVMTALKELENMNEICDIVFMDPPYNCEHEKHILLYLDKSPLIGDETLIVVEASDKTKFDYIDATSFEIVKVKEYKTNKHVMIMRKK